MKRGKQYIHYYDSKAEAWDSCIKLSEYIRDEYAVGELAVSVEYYKGKWWVIMIRL